MSLFLTTSPHFLADYDLRRIRANDPLYNAQFNYAVSENFVLILGCVVFIIESGLYYEFVNIYCNIGKFISKREKPFGKNTFFFQWKIVFNRL